MVMLLSCKTNFVFNQEGFTASTNCNHVSCSQLGWFQRFSKIRWPLTHLSTIRNCLKALNAQGIWNVSDVLFASKTVRSLSSWTRYLIKNVVTSQDISALVGCIKKLMALYEVQHCENCQIQPLNLAQVAPEKSSREQSWKKSQTASWKWHFSPDDSLGLQQSLCNINSSLGIFMSKYQKKTC